MKFRALISEGAAVKGLIALFALILIFHAVVMAGFVPVEMVWGGRLKSREELLRFESISIVLNFVMLVICAVRWRHIQKQESPRWMVFLFWAMALLFAFNTLGNVFAETFWEKIIFTPLTLVLCVLCVRLALR